MYNVALQKLKDSGTIKDYKVVNLDAEGNPGHSERGRNSQQVVLTFHDDKQLVMTTWCSGCAENTGFSFIVDGSN